ncbi:hypothetical protein SGUI_0919 [Serinicoccus hydrothermalis]|uniref:Uncharacterized protein n=1 Tax=Serinicoccus hydrothermalis TaxID=1758689 RepID=A0A1B1NAB5_9MICO|nr:hypothetical protein [Serinicoccus hydrothermalis]ANS78315.1 hypothetical protein SGUI_0919 [Serinicoccus hydrothermalis]
MGFSDLLDRMLGRPAAADDRMTLPAPPTAEDVNQALTSTEELLTSAALPSVVIARGRRVIDTVRDTVPRLEKLSGSDLGYTVIATATDYLPEAVGAYQRLPRRYADTRPVDGAKTSLMVLVDQLDLLGLTMDKVFDAVYRQDARELVAQGRFIAEKFGSAGAGGSLRVHEADHAPVPAAPPTGTEQADATAAVDETETGAAQDDPTGLNPLAPPQGVDR